MSMQNFIPTVWAAGINRELERNCVFVEDCNRKYEGQVKRRGDTVKILGVGRPTIKTIGRDKANESISAPEELEDNSQIMTINQLSYYNYRVGDIDKAQANEEYDAAIKGETSEALSNEVDKYIASLVMSSGVAKLNSSASQVTASNVLSMIDDAQQALFENDVSGNTQIIIDASPKFCKLLRQSLYNKDTDNSDLLLKQNVVAMYGKIKIKMSNNVHKTSDGADNIMIRTQRAIAFAQPLTHVEAYRPENYFADAIKGYILYDAKVVRPKEIININVKY